MNSVFAYYLAWILLSYAVRQPWLLLGLGVLLVLQRFLPSPGALLRLFGRARSLRSQVELNRANITARRDLAVIYLDGRRARSAVPLLEEGLALSPDDAELLYLLGLALHRTGQHEQALARLVRAVEVDARVRYGLPYVVAGDALAALKRWEEALDAYERYLDSNSSDVSGYTRVARARVRTGDLAGAREALYEGLRTWSVLPGSMKRRQWGRLLAAHWARVSLLRERRAIVELLLMSMFLVFVLRFAAVPVVSWLTASGGGQRALHSAFARCGSQSTGNFAGRYAVLDERLRDRFANLEIRRDRIVAGESPVQEFCLTRVLQSSETSLLAEALWHEDIADPRDASLVRIWLVRQGPVTSLQWKSLEAPKNRAPLQLTLKPL